MKTIIEFNWNTNYKFIFFHNIILIFKIFYSNSSKFNIKKNKNSTIMFELITECSLMFSIIPFLIEKYKKRNLKKKNRIKSIKIKQKHKNNNLKILILIIISSLIKFNFTIFCFEVFNVYFSNIIKYSDYYKNSIMILSLILFIILKNKILKKNFYLHHLISMALIILTLILIAIISLSIEEVNKYLGIKFFLFVYFFFYIYFLIFLGYIIYKILTEKYFISIYIINFFEGLFYIFYTFIFYNYKIKNDNESNYRNLFEFDVINLFITCILQNLLNIMIKLIIYYFDEIFVTISILMNGSLKIILDMLLDNIQHYKWNISLLLLYIFLIFNLLIFIEVIIVKIFNLEKKTKKYLDKEQEREKTKKRNISRRALSTC